MGSPDLETTLKQNKHTGELLQATKDVIFTRDTLDIPTDDRHDNFTVGTLATPSCFASSPAVAVSRSQKTVVAVYHLGRGFTGHKGFVHGGVIATILDECCGRASLSHFNPPENRENGTNHSNSDGLPKAPQGAVTAQMTVNYIAPVHTDSSIIIKAAVVEGESTDRKAKVAAQLFTLKGEEEVLAASADSLFITPKMK